MKQNHYARKKRQLKVLAEKLQQQLAYQKEGASKQIKKLIIKINKLVQELILVISQSDLKKIFGAVAIFIGVSFTNQAIAQSFAPPVENPFGLVSTYETASPDFVDLDDDGDFDLLVGEYYIGNLQYFENIGDSANPQFTTPVENPFGLVPTYYNFPQPSFADFDKDGDEDLLVGNYGYLEYFENTGSPQNPQFGTPIIDPFGLYATTDWSVIPAITDLDNDGDLDVLTGEYPPKILYFENIGDSANPQFTTPVENPFGLNYIIDSPSPAFVDLDDDGDMDIFIGEYFDNGNIYYFENTGSSISPQFNPPLINPFGLVPTNITANPAFTDLDGDNDMDLLVGEESGSMQYFENTTITTIAHVHQNTNLKLFPNPVIDILNIVTDNKIERIEILNVLGDEVLSFRNNYNEISLSNIKPGIYTVKITLSNDKCIVRKIVKK
ncbi:MAG: T9SS type A sorting domain-containing protein [Bacteroidales bacterium]|nr:T9SS type A sorting domain-containing protein [Bacteroidales bacterium]